MIFLIIECVVDSPHDDSSKWPFLEVGGRRTQGGSVNFIRKSNKVKNRIMKSDEGLRMAKFVKIEEMEWKQPAPNINAKIVTGKKITAQLVHLEKGTTMDAHSHVEEQLGYVIEGKLEFILGPARESHIAEAGTFFCFEPNEIHGVRDTLEKTVVLDIFGPVRKDYLHLAVDMTEG